MKPESISGAELRAMASPPKVVRRDGKGNIDFYNARLDNWGYWIDQDEVSTRRGLIRFLRHLSEKNWITTAHLRELIDVAHAVVGKSPFN